MQVLIITRDRIIARRPKSLILTYILIAISSAILGMLATSLYYQNSTNNLCWKSGFARGFISAIDSCHGHYQFFSQHFKNEENAEKDEDIPIIIEASGILHDGKYKPVSLPTDRIRFELKDQNTLEN